MNNWIVLISGDNTMQTVAKIQQAREEDPGALLVALVKTKKQEAVIVEIIDQADAVFAQHENCDSYWDDITEVFSKIIKREGTIVNLGIVDIRSTICNRGNIVHAYTTTLDNVQPELQQLTAKLNQDKYVVTGAIIAFICNIDTFNLTDILDCSDLLNGCLHEDANVLFAVFKNDSLSEQMKVTVLYV